MDFHCRVHLPRRFSRSEPKLKLFLLQNSISIPLGIFKKMGSFARSGTRQVKITVKGDMGFENRS